MAALPHNKSILSKPEEEKKDMVQTPTSTTGKVMVEIRRTSIDEMLKMWENKSYVIYLFQICIHIINIIYNTNIYKLYNILT